LDSAENLNQKIATIIILTANASSEHTRRTIECVEKFTKLPYELFVLRDDKKHFGFSRDNNRLMRIAEGKYIVLLNDDCFVSENWLEKMIEAAESGSSIGLVGVELIKSNHEAHVYGRPFDFGDGHIRPIFTRVFRQFPLYNEWIAFALVLIKRDVLKKIGYLDETFNLGFEDNDYCLRVRNAGFDIVSSDMEVQHLTNTSSKSFASINKMVKGFLIFYRRLHWPIIKILFVGSWWSLTAYSRKLLK
jgi:GT2 family glycosyltransferase